MAQKTKKQFRSTFLMVLSVLAIVIGLGACPTEDSDVDGPTLDKAEIDSSHGMVTLTFNEDIINNKSSDSALKGVITVARDGVTTYAALGANDLVSISGRILTIIFATPLTGTTNTIRIASEALKDASGNTNSVITSSALTGDAAAAPSASTPALTVTGTVGTALTDKDVVITLAGGGKLKAIAADADLSAWITTLPAGMTAKAKAVVAADATTMTITIGGTPTAASSATFTITIPVASLNHPGATAITVAIGTGTTGTWGITAAASTTVTLAPGSYGTAGNATITGLTANSKYIVKGGTATTPTWQVLKADGTLNAAATLDAVIAGATGLTGTAITGLTNGTTYDVYEVKGGGDGDTTDLASKHKVIDISALINANTHIVKDTGTSSSGVGIVYIGTAITSTPALTAAIPAAQSIVAGTVHTYTLGTTTAGGATVTTVVSDKYFTFTQGTAAGTFTTTITVSS